MENTVCAIYIDLENNIPSNFDIKRLIEEIILRNQSVDKNNTIFAVKMACGNQSSIEKLEARLSEYNFDIRNVTKITSNYKNRADLIISLEAFETLIMDKPVIEKYIFITSDSDFTVIMEKLRKHGKQVWLITSLEASKKPIFSNTCNEVLIFDNFLDKNESISNESKTLELNKIKDTIPSRNEDFDENDLRAIAVFSRVLESLEHDNWYLNSNIGEIFHQIDKSLELKNTNFKNIGGLAKHFEKDKNLIETGKSKFGHVQIKLKD